MTISMAKTGNITLADMRTYVLDYNRNCSWCKYTRIYILVNIRLLIIDPYFRGFKWTFPFWKMTPRILTDYRYKISMENVGHWRPFDDSTLGILSLINPMGPTCPDKFSHLLFSHINSDYKGTYQNRVA